ncbi:MAG: transposase [Defluviitaleaceae bacterium]|nr:transposase [Defluviitaleaceae bacterium]
MVDRSRIDDKVIVVADRAYESYNNFAHIERKGWHYAIRVKDLGSSGILSGLDLPQDGEFDVRVSLVLTKKQTKEVKARPDIYKFVPSTFDFLDLHENKFYPISFLCTCSSRQRHI